MNSYTNIKGVNLMLENFYYFTISVEYIGVVKTGAVYNDGEHDCVSELALSIRHGFHCIETSHDDEISLQYLHMARDITWINVVYENGEKQTVYVDCWDEGKGWTNNCQHSKFNCYGDLFIVVSSDSLLLEREFPDEVINDYPINDDPPKEGDSLNIIIENHN